MKTLKIKKWRYKFDYFAEFLLKCFLVSWFFALLATNLLFLFGAINEEFMKESLPFGYFLLKSIGLILCYFVPTTIVSLLFIKEDEYKEEYYETYEVE